MYHEFGSDHRPFEWGAAIDTPYGPTELEYWLVQWIGVYGFLLEQVPEDDEQRLFVCYERLCRQAFLIWSRLCERLVILLQTEAATRFEARTDTAQAIGAGRLHDTAYAFYEALSTRPDEALIASARVLRFSYAAWTPSAPGVLDCRGACETVTVLQV